MNLNNNNNNNNIIYGKENVDIISKLKTAFINENGAPELLEYKTQLIHEVKQKIKKQEKLYKEVEEENVANYLIQMELERVKYLLNSYLRVRLSKITSMCQYLLSNPDFHKKLSTEEYDFAQRYGGLLHNHFQESFLKYIPEKISSLDETEVLPNLQSYVFCRIKEDIGQVEIEEDTTVLLNQNEILLVKYSAIRDLISEGKIDLL